MKWGALSIEKVPSTPANLADGVLGAIDNLDAARNSGGPLLRQLDRLVHGTTVAANCFLERKGARLGFITTMGLRDTLVMRRMFRENMYDTRTPEIVPLVSRINVFEVDERIDKHGKIVREMNEADVNKAIEEIRSRDLEAVGICFIFSFRNPEHELRVKQMLKERLPDIYVSTSFEVCPEIRDYERACTTHLERLLAAAVRALPEGARRRTREPTGIGQHADHAVLRRRDGSPGIGRTSLSTCCSRAPPVVSWPAPIGANAPAMPT